MASWTPTLRDLGGEMGRWHCSSSWDHLLEGHGTARPSMSTLLDVLAMLDHIGDHLINATFTDDDDRHSLEDRLTTRSEI